MYRINLLLFLSLIFFLTILTIIVKSRTEEEKGDFYSGNRSDQPKNETEVSNNNNVTVILGGDVMLGRNVMQTSLKNKDYSYPFEKIYNFSKNSDIFFINLENPIVENCPLSDSGFKFCTIPQMVEGLAGAGINVVDLANNHTLNYGPSGLLETKNYLSQNKIFFTGLGSLTIKKVNYLTFGFLGFDLTIKQLTDEDLLLVKESDSLVDYLIVGVHWGEEYKSKANSYQRNWAKAMVNNGADIIVGSHPHWVQDYECLNPSDGSSSCFDNDISSDCSCDGIKGKPVYYSLGNLVFDQMWSENTKMGILIKLEIGEKGIVSEERINTYIKNTGQPEIISEDIIY